jgi:uncharacterized protein with PIN domain
MRIYKKYRKGSVKNMGSGGRCFKCGKILIDISKHEDKDGFVSIPNDDILICKECSKDFGETISKMANSIFGHK